MYGPCLVTSLNVWAVFSQCSDFAGGGGGGGGGEGGKGVVGDLRNRDKQS